MMYRPSPLALAIALAAVVVAAPGRAQEAAPIKALVGSIDVPFERFTLANGLRVIVQTDRSAPVVSVAVWYDVGSKHEPKGKSGFAHLFEHLLFNGSENAPGDYQETMAQIGATGVQGTTFYDRTNYYETVPTPALDRILFLESDRMGYLLGVIDQAKLDEQREVVKQEKRENDNRPFGLIRYKVGEALFSADHPYGHATIGSMADLDRATLADVRAWFRDHYGPNNAVLVLSGDVDAATARRLVERYFGAIPAGPRNATPLAPVPPLPSRREETTTDRVPAPSLFRAWATPGLNDPAAPALQALAATGRNPTSLLKDTLLRRSTLFTSVGISHQPFAQVGTFSIDAGVAKGADLVEANRVLDATIAAFLAAGPSADDVARYVAGDVTNKVLALEGTGGRSRVLAEGELYSSDPGFFKRNLTAIAALTPASIRAAAARWIGSRPPYRLTVMPGVRPPYADSTGIAPPSAAPVAIVRRPRGPVPAIGAITAFPFPAVDHARLSNGIELVYSQRKGVPITTVGVGFDAGSAADGPARPGVQRLALESLDKGTTAMTAAQIASARDRLGAAIDLRPGEDRTLISLFTPSTNLDATTAIVADIVRHPAFPAAEVARTRADQVAEMEEGQGDPGNLAGMVLATVINAGTPYAQPPATVSRAQALAGLTRDDLVAFQRAWLRPEKAKIFVVSDRPLAEVRAIFDRYFGDWTGTGPAGVKAVAVPVAPMPAQIVLIDVPDTPQSAVVGGLRTNRTGADERTALTIANSGLGGGFSSRINMDLRETKHWTYGASGIFSPRVFDLPYAVLTSVQADKTGATIAALRDQIAGYVGARPMTKAEFDLAIAQETRSLASNMQGSSSVMGMMMENDQYRRPDDYVATLGARYGALTLAEARSAIAGAIDPAAFVWVVAGDAATVRPQLRSLGLPVREMTIADVIRGASPH